MQVARFGQTTWAARDRRPSKAAAEAQVTRLECCNTPRVPAIPRLEYLLAQAEQAAGKAAAEAQVTRLECLLYHA